MNAGKEIRMPLGNGINGRFNRSEHHRGWMEVYPQFAARLNARVEDDGQQVVLVFDVGSWEEANAILYATTPKSTPPLNGK